jgi:aspartate/methionine/tyrosine aminotransferase
MNSRIPVPFELERFFALHEFEAAYLLSASDCESLTLPEVLALADSDSQARWQRLSLGYTESQGDPALRAAIAEQYSVLTPDDIVVLVPEEGIYLAMHVLLEPGQHVIATHPAYQSLHEVARSFGCAVSDWPVVPDASGRAWSLDLQQLEHLLRRETRLLVINFPHNPTGFVPDRAQFEAVVALARQRGLFVFSDEMYRGLEHDVAHKLPAVADIYERGISLAGLSKTHAAPGLRLGWLGTRAPGVLERLLVYKDYTTICNSAPSEVLALMVLRASSAILDRNRALIMANLECAREFATRHSSLFRWMVPQGGSIAFPGWTGPESVEALCQRVLAEQNTLIVPGRFFGHSGSHLRLGLGRANFPEALRRVESVLPSGVGA